MPEGMCTTHFLLSSQYASEWLTLVKICYTKLTFQRCCNCQLIEDLSMLVAAFTNRIMGCTLWILQAFVISFLQRRSYDLWDEAVMKVGNIWNSDMCSSTVMLIISCENLMVKWPCHRLSERNEQIRSQIRF